MPMPKAGIDLPFFHLTSSVSHFTTGKLNPKNKLTTYIHTVDRTSTSIVSTYPIPMPTIVYQDTVLLLSLSASGREEVHFKKLVHMISTDTAKFTSSILTT